MATLTIRDLPDGIRDKLRVRAAEKGRSMEAEVRSVLSDAVGVRPGTDGRTDWVTAVREAQKAFAHLPRSTILASDELVAERRLEAAREDRDADAWLRANADTRL